jgi:hypothetical protein
MDLAVDTDRPLAERGSSVEERSMVGDLEAGHLERSVDGGCDLGQERGRVRRPEVRVERRPFLSLLEEQNAVRVVGRAPEAVVDAACLFDGVRAHVLGRRDRGLALVRVHLRPGSDDDHVFSPWFALSLLIDARSLNAVTPPS